MGINYKAIKEIAINLAEKGELNSEKWKELDRRIRKAYAIQHAMFLTSVFLVLFTPIATWPFFVFSGIVVYGFGYSYVRNKLFTLTRLYTLGTKTEGTLFHSERKKKPDILTPMSEMKPEGISVSYCFKNASTTDWRGYTHLPKSDSMYEHIDKLNIDDTLKIVFIESDPSQSGIFSKEIDESFNLRKSN
jgi:hypothetical protein